MSDEGKTKIPGYVKLEIDVDSGKIYSGMSMVDTEEEYLIGQKQLRDLTKAVKDVLKAMLVKGDDPPIVKEPYGRDNDVT